MMNLKTTGKRFVAVGSIAIIIVFTHRFLREMNEEIVKTIGYGAWALMILGVLFLFGDSYACREEAKRDGYKFHVGQVVQYISEEDWQFKNRFGTITETFLDGNQERWYIIEEADESMFHVPECYVMDTV